MVLHVRWEDTSRIGGRIDCKDCSYNTPKYIMSNDLELMESTLFCGNEINNNF